MKGLGADGRYWEALNRGELELPRCSVCRCWHWPAPFRCSECGSWAIDWIPTPMEGVVYTWTRTWQPFPGTEHMGSPFVSLLVELPQAAGIRLLGIYSDNETPKIGDKVSGSVTISHTDGRDIPAIRWTGELS